MSEMEFIDAPHAQEFFADGTSGLFLANGNVRITFEAARANHTTPPAPVNRVVVGRVVMPAAAAEKLAHAILKFLEDKKNKITPSAQSITTLQ